MQQPIMDAAAAPANPHPNTRMKRASRAMLVNPQASDSRVPSSGFSAVIKKG